MKQIGAYISLRKYYYGIGFSAPSRHQEPPCPLKLFQKRPQRQNFSLLGRLPFSSIMALASMAESKTTIGVLVVSVVLGVGCLIGRLFLKVFPNLLKKKYSTLLLSFDI